MNQNLVSELQFDHFQLKELRIAWMLRVYVGFDLLCPLALVFEDICHILIRESNIFSARNIVKEFKIEINSGLVDEQAKAISVKICSFCFIIASIPSSQSPLILWNDSYLMVDDELFESISLDPGVLQRRRKNLKFANQ